MYYYPNRINPVDAPFVTLYGGINQTLMSLKRLDDNPVRLYYVGYQRTERGVVYTIEITGETVKRFESVYPHKSLDEDNLRILKNKINNGKLVVSTVGLHMIKIYSIYELDLPEDSDILKRGMTLEEMSEQIDQISDQSPESKHFLEFVAEWLTVGDII